MKAVTEPNQEIIARHLIAVTCQVIWLFCFIVMPNKLRKFHRRALSLYEEAFGEIENPNNFYLLRPCDSGVVVIKAAHTETTNAYQVLDQVLISNDKIYRYNELVYERDGVKDGTELV